MSARLESIKIPARSLGTALKWAILVAALVVAGLIGAFIGSRVGGAATSQSRQPPAVVSHSSGGASGAGAVSFCRTGPVGPC